MHEIELLATVAVRGDVPELGLCAGEVGAVVEVLSADAFEVEFVDHQGKTYGLHTLTREQLLPLNQGGRAWRVRGSEASKSNQGGRSPSCVDVLRIAVATVQKEQGIWVGPVLIERTNGDWIVRTSFGNKGCNAVIHIRGSDGQLLSYQFSVR